MNRNQDYIEIVRACLRALNATVQGEADRTDAIERAYEAIDTAFEKQFADYQQLIAELAETLNTIAQSDNAAEQRELALTALRRLGRGTSAH